LGRRRLSGVRRFIGRAELAPQREVVGHAPMGDDLAAAEVLDFTDPARRSFYVDWDTLGQGIVAQFRAGSARSPGDPWFATLIEDLRAASPEFRAWWPRHDVCSGLDGRKELEHPGVGRLALEYISLHAPATPGLKVIIYTPLPEAETASKLGRLLSGATGV